MMMFEVFFSLEISLRPSPSGLPRQLTSMLWNVSTFILSFYYLFQWRNISSLWREHKYTASYSMCLNNGRKYSLRMIWTSCTDRIPMRQENWNKRRSFFWSSVPEACILARTLKLKISHYFSAPHKQKRINQRDRNWTGRTEWTRIWATATMLPTASFTKGKLHGGLQLASGKIFAAKLWCPAIYESNVCPSTTYKCFPNRSYAEWSGATFSTWLWCRLRALIPSVNLLTPLGRPVFRSMGHRPI